MGSAAKSSRAAFDNAATNLFDPIDDAVIIFVLFDMMPPSLWVPLPCLLNVMFGLPFLSLIIFVFLILSSPHAIC